jgi:hypothetical protein
LAVNYWREWIVLQVLLREDIRRIAASVNSVAFNRAIPLGSVVTVEAKVSELSKVRWRFLSTSG